MRRVASLSKASGRLLASARAALFAAFVLHAGAAAAFDPPSLGDFLFGHGPKAGLASGRYGVDAGDGFVVDRADPQTLLVRYGDSSEVWTLHPVSAPRGDVIYKNDMGEPVLRATRIGGLTLFSWRHPTGSAAAFIGEAPPLRLAPVPNPNALFQALVQASVRASHAAQHLVVFEAQDLTPHDLAPESSAVIADAAATTADAFLRLSYRGPTGRLAATHIDRVQFTTGRDADARTRGPIMVITLNPAKGFAGRPSSARILAVMQKN